MAGDPEFEALKVEFRDRLDQLPALVEPGETCHLCPRDAVTFVPLIAQDPDQRGTEVKLDLLVCAPCHARVAPRVRVSASAKVIRRLIQLAAVDIEAYERAVPDGRAPLRLPVRGA